LFVLTIAGVDAIAEFTKTIAPPFFILLAVVVVATLEISVM